MLLVMTVRIEPQAATEAGFAGDLILGHRLKERDEPLVRLVPLAQDLSKRQLAPLCDHLGVEGINATVHVRVPLFG